MENGRKELHRTDVDCPEQTKAYCETSRWIDKGNHVEAKFYLGWESHLHGWSPKLASRLFNIQLNNVYRIYCALLSRENYTPKLLSDCIADLPVAMLSRGSGIPPIGADMGSTYAIWEGHIWFFVLTNDLMENNCFQNKRMIGISHISKWKGVESNYFPWDLETMQAIQ